MKLEFLKLGLGTFILRFYLTMALVIIAGFSGFWIIGMLAVVVFLSALLGVQLIFGQEDAPTPIHKLRDTEVRKTA